MPMLKRHWTVDDLADLPDDGQRYEVIDGELFVTPSPSARHQAALAELFVLLREYLSRERVGYAYFAPADVIFSPTRAVQPDLLVLPLINGRRPDQFGNVGRLLFAAEVLSPSTARADRVKSAACSAMRASLTIGSSTSTRERSSVRRRPIREWRASSTESSGFRLALNRRSS